MFGNDFRLANGLSMLTDDRLTNNLETYQSRKFPKPTEKGESVHPSTIRSSSVDTVISPKELSKPVSDSVRLTNKF